MQRRELLSNLLAWNTTPSLTVSPQPGRPVGDPRVGLLPRSPLFGTDVRVNPGFDFFALPMPQAGSSKIVFTSNRDGRAQIYSMNVDGSGLIRITTSAYNDDHPRWSPNGTKILFQSDRDNPETGNADIYVMNANGTSQTRLTYDAADDSAAVWSPDGNKIVFQSLRNGQYYQVYVMNADGTNQVNLSNGIGADSQPSWSPDGSKIAFASERDQAGTPSVYVMNANGSTQIRLTFGSEPFRDEQPAWSPDGSRIAFVSTRDSVVVTWQETDDEGGILNRSSVRTNKEIYVMNAGGMIQDRATHTLENDDAPYWSPDGTNQVRLTNTLENDDSPYWSPDGTQIIFRSDRERDAYDPTQQLWMMNTDGSNQTLLAGNGFGDYSPSWNTSAANQPPVANPGGPYSGATGTAIQFNGSGSSDPDGTITGYSWNFGDSGSGTGATPLHTYATAGNYTVTLTVTDNKGATASATATATIGNRPPVANAGGPYSGAAGTAIQFNGGGSNDPDGTIAGYSWNFGDSGSGTGATPWHTYATTGNYTVTLTVTDNNGAQASANSTSTIGNRPPVANAGGPYNGTAGTAIQFNGGGSNDPDGTITSYSWSFGDGGTGSGASPTHAFASAGTYTVTLTVTDNQGAQASANTSATISTAGSEPYLVNFNQSALARQPYANESGYWIDILRAAYANGQSSKLLAMRELGKTLFESSDYAARNRDNHWYVYDLYKTYLMREPDGPGWAFWENECNNYGRENVRRAFDECGEFAGIVATLTPSGSPSSNVSSLATARVDPFNQPGSGLTARDAEWSVPLLSLPGRAGLDLGLSLSYSSMIWTRSGPYIYFDEDNGWPSAGFRLGFPTIQEKVFDAQAGRNVYLMISGGGRVSLRQLGTSNVYEAVDSSYLQLIDNGGSLLVRTSDGTQLSYLKFNNEWRCTQIKDRNGNYITVNYDWLGHITTITDTLARTITFNYDGNANLLSITQSWTVNGVATTHTWATFGWGNLSLQSSFSGVMAVGPPNGSTIPVLTQVGLDDSSHHNFEYNSSAQVNLIRSYRSDNLQRAYTAFNYGAPADDCPRLSATRVWAENWTGLNGVPSEVVTQYSAPGDGSHQLSAPDGTVYKEFYGAGWQRGLTTQTEVWSGGVRQKWTTTNWTQDNTGVNYQTNPRVTETNVYDAGGNRRRTTVDYSPPQYAQFGLPYFVSEYAADGATEIRRSYKDYHLAQAYLDRRIIGLVAAQHVLDPVAGLWQSKVTYGYDDPAKLGSQATTATQHDQSYSASFTTRGNVTSVSHWDVTDISNATKALISQASYDAAGSVLTSADPLGHQSSIAYADSFSDGTDHNTFANPTTATDADGFSTSLQYNFDIGARTRIQGPPPTNQTQGLIQTFAYDNAGRIDRITTANNGAYRRFVYGPNYVQEFGSVNNVADDSYAVQVIDGLGRVYASAGYHPGSAGGYKAQLSYYNLMGRAMMQSNPTEITGSWVPTGDDAAGWLFTQQTYDWQGRPRITTNTDGTTKEASYSGCGCAGGAVVTRTDEGTIDGGVSKRRQQKIYSDVLGRTVKTELLNWQGGSVYSTTMNNYNARDQVKQVRQYAGAEGSGTYQDTTMTYDGYGRLTTRHVPGQDAGAATLWDYNADDTIQRVTDARGATQTLGYNARHLVTGVTYAAPEGITIPAPVSYDYDAAGNRTSMSDGSGSTTYQFTQLSQLASETRQFSGLTGSYTLSYEYTLAGQLKKVSDATNTTINYSFDQAGRLTNVTGSDNLVGGVSNYASNFQYRAWNGLKAMTDGGNVTTSLLYNAKLQPTQFQLSGGIVTQNYDYYNDGRIKFLHNTPDNNFDRSYFYDHVGRLTENKTGGQARGDGGQVPYQETFGYNAFADLTARYTGTWNQFVAYDSASYTNNRRNGWGYDADGRNTAIEDRSYRFDAAGQPVSMNGPMWISEHQVYGTATMDSSYDGGGAKVKEVSGDLQNHNPSVTTYYLRSSVLGGAIVEEIDSSGQKQVGYVYASGQLLARQSGSQVVWKHRTPAGTSQYETGGSIGRIEFDPLGADITLNATAPPDDPPLGGGGLEGGHFAGIMDQRYSDMFNLSGGCTLDGFAASCSFAMMGINTDTGYDEGEFHCYGLGCIFGGQSQPNPGNGNGSGSNHETGHTGSSTQTGSTGTSAQSDGHGYFSMFGMGYMASNIPSIGNFTVDVPISFEGMIGVGVYITANGILMPPQNPAPDKYVLDKYKKQFNAALTEAEKRLKAEKCAKLFGKSAEDLIAMLQNTEYRILPLASGGPKYDSATNTSSVTGAQTNSPTSVFVNSKGPFLNTVMFVPGAPRNPVRLDFNSGLRGAEFGALLLLHELGHQVKQFGPDASDYKINLGHTKQVLKACF